MREGLFNVASHGPIIGSFARVKQTTRRLFLLNRADAAMELRKQWLRASGGESKAARKRLAEPHQPGYGERRENLCWVRSSLPIVPISVVSAFHSRLSRQRWRILVPKKLHLHHHRFGRRLGGWLGVFAEVRDQRTRLASPLSHASPSLTSGNGDMLNAPPVQRTGEIDPRRVVQHSSLSAPRSPANPT